MPVTTVRPLVVAMATVALLLAGLTAPAGAEHRAVGVSQGAAQAVSQGAVDAPVTAANKGKKKKKKKRCLPGNAHPREYVRVCFKLVKTKYKVKRVEAVPLRNKSSQTVTMHCSFTKTISRSVQKKAGLSSTAEVNAVFGLAKLNVSVNVEKSVTQTASQATTAGGSVVLAPGQKVTCIRTYGHVVTKVKRTDQRNDEKKTRIIKTKIPSSLGVDIID